jgi:D-amino-acid dehydrogenase
MADVVVVGAGVAGASVAFAAARRGASVTVVDDGRPGRATAAGAGIIAPWATSLSGDVYRLYSAGADAYPLLLAALGEVGIDDVGYARNGALVATSDPDEAAAMLGRLTPRAAGSEVAGLPELIDAAEVRRLFPALSPDLLGVHVPGGARVDGRRLAAGLLDGVTRLGGTVLEGVATLADGQVVVDGTVHGSDTVVVAAGAWVGALLADRTTIAVAAQRGQLCHLRLDGVETGRWPSVIAPGNHYIVPFDDGRVVVGATREPDVDDVRVTADGVASVLALALEAAPGLGAATLLETRVGLRPYPTIDHRPTVGPIDDRTWVVTGFGAIGLTIGPTVGERVAGTLLGGADDELLTPFAPI